MLSSAPVGSSASKISGSFIRARARYPLHLSAGKLVGAGVYFIFQPYFFKYGNRTFAAFFRAYTRQGERKFHVFHNGLVGDKVVTLKNESYGVIAVSVPVFIRKIGGAFAVYYKVARSIAVESAYNVEQRCFAAARRT